MNRVTGRACRRVQGENFCSLTVARVNTSRSRSTHVPTTEVGEPGAGVGRIEQTKTRITVVSTVIDIGICGVDEPPLDVVAYSVIFEPIEN